MLHDHSRDSAAAAMSSAAWIPWPRSLALASLGRTSSRSGASLTAQVVELAGFLGRSGDPVVTIGSVGRSCLATGARLGRSNGQIDHVPERHPRLLVFILANIDQVVIAILDETELRRTPDCERDRQQDGHCQVRSVRFEPVRVAPPRPVAIKLKIRAGLGDVFPSLAGFSVRLHSQANASPLAAGGARPSVAGTIGPVGVDVQRWGRALDDLPRDRHLLDILEARQIEHDSEQDALYDRPQSARPRLALDGLPGDRPERLFRSYTTSWFAYPL